VSSRARAIALPGGRQVGILDKLARIRGNTVGILRASLKNFASVDAPMPSPLLILSDVHLSRAYGAETAIALAHLIQKFPTSELILAGDILDLSLDAPQLSYKESLRSALAPHHQLTSVLREHVERGQKVTFIPGNHDSGLDSPEATQILRSTLGCIDGQRVQVTPWFTRRGEIHIEHGHLYDPDCANNHPLAPPNPYSEGLGTALMRRFCSPNDALRFAHANQVTPASGFLQAIESWGSRAPLLINNYFRTAIKLCLEAAFHGERVERAKRQGAARLSRHAQLTGVSELDLRSLLVLAPEPTHTSFRATFLRLYFDRILAGGTALMGTSLILAGTLEFVPHKVLLLGGLLLAGGVAYLVDNLLKKKNRYGNCVIDQLAAAAEGIRAITGSSLVVFGHSHVEVESPGYINLGSFGLSPEARPYLIVDSNGQATKAHLLRDSTT